MLDKRGEMCPPIRGRRKVASFALTLVAAAVMSGFSSSALAEEISGNQTYNNSNLTAENADNTVTVDAIALKVIERGSANFTGTSASLSATNASNVYESDKNWPSVTSGLYVYGAGRVTSEAGTVLTITGESTGAGTVTELGQNTNADPNNFAGFVTGIQTEGGTLNLQGKTTVKATGNGAYAVGMSLQALSGDSDWVQTNYDELVENNEFNMSATFGGDLTVEATSQTGGAEAIRLGGYVPGEGDPDGTYDYPQNVTVVLNTSKTGVTTITAETGNESLQSVGVNFVYPDDEGGDPIDTPEEFTTARGVLNLNGTTIITADHALMGDTGTVNNAGDLTLNGRVDQFKGNFTQTAGTTTLKDSTGGFFGGNVTIRGGSMDAGSSAWESAEGGSLTVSGGELQIGEVHVSEEGAFNFTGGGITVNGQDVEGAAFSIATGVKVEASDEASLTINGDAVFSGELTGLKELYFDNGRIYTTDDARVEVAGNIVVGGNAIMGSEQHHKAHVNFQRLDLLEGATFIDDSSASDNAVEFGSGTIVFHGNNEIYLVPENGVMSKAETIWANDEGDSHAALDLRFAGGSFDLNIEGENGSVTIENGTRFTSGEIRISDAAIHVLGGEAGAGNLTVGTLTFNEGGTGSLVVNGGTLAATTINAASGSATLTSGTFHVDTLSAQGAFTVNAANEGFTVGTFVGAEGGNFTLASGTMAADAIDLAAGKLTVAAGANLATYSGQIFTEGLNEEGNNPNAGSLRYTEDHLSFADNGKLTLRDQFYNDDYAASAGSLLNGVSISFSGTAVDSAGEVVTEKPFEDMTEGVTQETVTITASGDENGNFTVDKTTGGKDLALDETVTNVTVTGDKTLTLVGSAEGGELVSFANEGQTSVTVNGGLALGGAEEATKGSITSTVDLADNATLTAPNGDFTLSTVNAAAGANIEVASGKLAVENLKLTGDTTLASAAGAVTEVTNVTTETGTHQLKGEISVGTVAGSGTLLVGSAQEESSASSTLNVDKLTHTGVIFIDPAWTDGATMTDGSFLTVQQLDEQGNLNAHVVAGQHSTFVFGSTKDEAVQAFAKTGLTYGQEDVSAVLYVAKAINIGNGSIKVDGSMSELGSYSGTAGSLTVAAHGLAMIDAKALTDGAAITADTVTFDEGSHIRVVNLTKTSEGTLIAATAENGLTIADSVIEDAKSTSAMVSLDLTKNDDGTLSYSTTLNNAADVFTGFEGAGLMDAMHEASMNDVDSADRATKFLSRMAAYSDYGVATAGAATAIGNQAMALAATSGVYNIALDASKLMNRAVDGRMSIANGLMHAEGATVWADVLATTNEAESLYGDSGYDVDLYGGVLGVDVGLGNGKLVGAALTVGTGDGGSKGAALDVDNDADFVGLSVYGSHRLGDFNGKIDLGWMHTTSDLSASVYGMSIGDEVEADAWTFGIGAEYLFNVGSVNIVPHVGIRWTRLEVDGYEGAFKTDDDSMDVFTAPIGVAFSGNIEAAGWTFAPKVDLAIVPSFGDDEATSKVRWGNVSQTIKTNVVDDAPFQAALGLDATNGSWTFGAFYDLGIGGDDRLDNAFTLKARYAF